MCIQGELEPHPYSNEKFVICSLLMPGVDEFKFQDHNGILLYLTCAETLNTHGMP